MKAYKCDRCKALFEPKENAPKFRVEKYEGDWEYEDVDLCPSCLIELERFMKEKSRGQTMKLMEQAGYNDHDGGFEKCPFCGEVYNGYERIVMGLKNEEPFECRKCKQIIAFRP